MSTKQSSKQTKQSKPVVEAAPAPVVAAPAPAPAPAPSSSEPKAKKAKKETKPVEPIVAPSTATSEPVSMSVETLPEAEHVAAETSNDVETRCLKFYSELQEVASKLSQMKSVFKSIERDYGKKLKSASKGHGKKKSGNRAPSGFVKPTKISDELAAFLGKPLGTEMARTDVTREINGYIRSNNLQDSANGRQINANPALSTLLKLKEGEVLTYFNLQKFMSVHFIKAAPAPASA
jgi:chromatin remodeling complex protein RSC6